MKIILYLTDMARCTTDRGVDPRGAKYQERLYKRAIELSYFLNSNDSKTVEAATVALEQLAKTHKCTIDFTRNAVSKRYEKVVIESRK
jgi:hypothetical protein